MPIDMQEILLGEQAGGLRRQADSSGNFMGMMDRKFLDVMTKPGIVEAAAGEKLLSADLGGRLAGLNAAHGTPNPATGPKG